MTAYELDNNKTGWLLLPGDADDIVAHYKDKAEACADIPALAEYITNYVR